MLWFEAPMYRWRPSLAWARSRRLVTVTIFFVRMSASWEFTVEMLQLFIEEVSNFFQRPRFLNMAPAARHVLVSVP